MRSKRGKRKPAPGIVPRFLKGAVTIGAIPALVGACEKPHQVQPVVAYFAPPSPQDASVTRPPPPVVAAYQRDIQPVVAAYAVDAALAPPPPIDAAPPVDAPAKKAKKGDRVPPPPPPPVVAAMVRGPGPAVVAAYVPREQVPVGSGSGSAAKKPKKP
jgi:hypothetical protein